MNRFEHLDVLRFPLACSVVMLHLCGKYTNWSIYDIDTFIKLSTYEHITLFTNIFGQLAVPTFFFISGFLFIGNKNFDVKIYKNKLLKRSRSILIPYCLWNTITLSVFLLQKMGGVIKGNDIVGTYDFLQCSNVIKYYTGDLSHLPGVPIDIPLWFIRDLYIMFLISPITIFLVKRLRDFYILFLFGLYCFQIYPMVVCFQIQTIAFFTLGVYIRMFNVDIVSLVSKYRSIIACISVISMSVRFVFGYSWLMPIFITFGFFCVIYGANYMKAKNIGKWLIQMNQYSFLVFALHYIVIRIFYGLFYNSYFEQNELIHCISYFCNIFLTVVICVSVFRILRKTAPSILLVLNGSR